MAVPVGFNDIRGINIQRAVTGFALTSYVFKDICTVRSGSAWEDRYFQETATELTGGTGSSVEGVPRLANFPYGQPTWTEVKSWMKKFGMEGVVSIEDGMTDSIDVIQRTLIRIGRAVAAAVDAEIWDVITESRSPSTINSVTITAGNEWDSATVANRDPIQNILDAKRAIMEDNYNPDTNTSLLLNPKDYANLLGNANVRNAGQFYTDDVTRNGRVGRLLGMTVRVSNQVTADYAAVVIDQEACTWVSVEPLTVRTIEEPGINTTIRAWEIGAAQLKNPNAVCLITNTAA